MKKFAVFTSALFISAVSAGLYGIIHDQITYTISPEYFTKFKYSQFGLQPEWFSGHRQTVAVIGFLATWWAGAVIGLVLGSVALIYPDYLTMRKAILRAILLTCCIALSAGFIGFIYGRFYLINQQVDWWLPAGLIDKNNFIVVGSIHNCSYLGGLIGMVIAMVYMVIKRKVTVT
jgi:hypothetical protein